MTDDSKNATSKTGEFFQGNSNIRIRHCRVIAVTTARALYTQRTERFLGPDASPLPFYSHLPIPCSLPSRTRTVPGKTPRNPKYSYIPLLTPEPSRATLYRRYLYLVAYTNSHPRKAVKSYRSTLRRAARKSLPVNQPDVSSARCPFVPELVSVLLRPQAPSRIKTTALLFVPRRRKIRRTEPSTACER